MRLLRLTDKGPEPIGVESRDPLGGPIGCRGRESQANYFREGGGVLPEIGCGAAGGRAGVNPGLLDTSAILGALLMVSVSPFPA